MKRMIKRNLYVFASILLIILIWVLAFEADRGASIELPTCLKGFFGDFSIDLKDLFCGIVKVEDPDLYSNFVEIWSVAITIMIFIIELSGNIKYGVSLKRITVLILGKVPIYIIAGMYLALYPIAYLLLQFSYQYTLFACWMTAVIGLGVTLFFCVSNTRAKNVRKILKDDTIKVLKRKYENSVSSDLDEKYSVCGEIDSLSITDMIIHTDFSNMEEMKNSISTLLEVLTDCDIQRCLRGTFAEHTILMNWIMRICQCFNLKEERKRQVLLELLRNMWTSLQNHFLNSYDINIGREKIVSYSIQMMIPLMMLDDDYKLLWSFLSEIHGYQKESMVYLLMYMEYRYWTYDAHLINSFMDRNSKSIDINNIFRDIAYGDFVFNRNFASNLWMDWSQYNYQLNCMGLQQFQQFADTAEQMIGGNDWRNSKCFTLEYLTIKWKR